MKGPSPIQVASDELERYTVRGVFSGLSRGPASAARAEFLVVWHHGREFQLVVDRRRGAVRFPILLPNVPAGSAMDRELRAFVRSRHSETLAEHRRIDPERSEVRVFNRGGHLSVILKVKDGNYRYGVRKLVHLVHEIFLDFLYDGRWRDYMVANFDLAPDAW